MSGHPIVFDFTEIQEQIQIKWHTYHTQACLETVLCLHKIHFLQNLTFYVNLSHCVLLSIVFVHSYLCNCFCAFVLVYFYLCICHCVFEVHQGNDDSLAAGGWEIHFSPQWSLTPTFSRTKLNFSFSAKQLEA